MQNNPKLYDEEDIEALPVGYLPYVVNTTVRNEYTFPIDEEIGAPSYYRNLIRVLDEAVEGDVVVLKINSNGGRGDSCSAILHAIQFTEATTVGEIVCDCHSAVSLIALSCDVLIVSDFANMLCHSARFGTGGKSTDVLASAMHHKKISDSMITNAYKDFLTDEEIADVINGKELYLDAEQINQRALKRVELRNTDTEGVDEEVELEIQPEPVKRSARKRKD